MLIIDNISIELHLLIRYCFLHFRYEESLPRIDELENTKTKLQKRLQGKTLIHIVRKALILKIG